MLYKKLVGLVFLSISFGMFLVIMLSAWSYVVAAIFAVIGFYLLFLCY